MVSFTHLDTASSTPASRILSAVIAGVLGVVFGTVGTIAHQSSIMIFGTSVFIGIVVALIGISALSIAVRLLFDERWPSVALAVGVIVAVLIFSTVSAGGSILIPEGILGFAWTIYAPLVVIITALWPRRPSIRGQHSA